MKVRKSIIISVVALSLFLAHSVYARPTAKKLYSQAIAAVNAEQTHFAFIYFNSLLDKYPNCKFAEEALFVVGEYYFSTKDYRDAGIVFRRFINKYPDSRAGPFARVYLLRLAKTNNSEKLAKQLERGIINSQQLSLLFRDFKEHKYSSASRRKYKAVYFIDKIEFYMDEELFEEISY